MTLVGKVVSAFLRFIFLPLLLTHACLADAPKWDKLTSSVDSFIAAYLKEHGAPGCVVAIVGPKDVYFLKSYGVKKLGKPEKLNPKTLFQLGSVSKPLSSTLMVKLYGDKRIDLNAAVTEYMNNFHLKGQEEPLLVKHLLSHTSGIPRYGFNPLIETHPERSELLRMAQTVKPVAPPGDVFDYHNVMFALIGDIIEAAENKPFNEVMDSHLLEPLGMKHACVGFNCLIESNNQATPHIKNEKGKIIPLNSYSTAYYAVSPSGGINASMEDMIPFLKAHLGGQPEFLSQGARNLLHLPQVTQKISPEEMKAKSEYIENMGYALGWRWMDYGGERVVYHGGWLKGFHNMIAFLPDHDIGIIILHNAETNLPWKTTCKFLDLVLDQEK
jgi:beta-lactamase class C